MFKKMNSKVRVKGETNISQHITFRFSSFLSLSTSNIRGDNQSQVKTSNMILNGVEEKNLQIPLPTFLRASLSPLMALVSYNLLTVS